MLNFIHMNSMICQHRNQIQDISKPTDLKKIVCDKCVNAGDTWVSLRMCLTCGNIGCCDSSKNKHATEHFKLTKHPIMKSVTNGEDFTWCYIDKTYI